MSGRASTAADEARGVHPIFVAGAGFGLALLLAIRILVPAGWDPSALASFGIEAEPTLDYARTRLGEVTARSFQGHDGKFFFVQANDPLLIDPATHATVLDRPTYRSQRMLYPLLAGAGGLLPPSAIIWTLLAVNLVAMGVGAGALAAYAARLGLNPWFGLAFPLNPGIIHELSVDGAGVVAFSLVCGAVLAITNNRTATSATLLVLACLTREVMLLAALGIAVWLWIQDRKKAAWPQALGPLAFVVGWALYLRLRLPGGDPAEVQEIGFPFIGLVDAAKAWIQSPAHLVVGAVVVLFLVLLASQIVRGRSDPLAYVAAGFGALAIFLTAQVWRAEFDITRAVAPVLTAVIVNPLFRSHTSLADSTLEA